MSLRRRPIVPAAAAFAIFAAAGCAIVLQGERLHENQRKHAAEEAGAGAAFTVERELSRALSATYALAALVRQRGELDDFEALAAEMLPTYGAVSNLQLAPGAVVTRIHPRAGNEAAIGHDLLRDPDRRFQARAAVESRQLTVAGPFALKQGGVGMVGRLAVFVPDADALGGERFWGLVSAVVKVDALLEVARVERLDEAGYAWELWWKEPVRQTHQRIAGAGTLPPGALHLPVEIPGGAWTLSVAPAGGWRPTPGLPLQYALALLGAGALAAAVYVITRQPHVLRRRVALRTAELAEANRRLAADVAERTRAEAALALTQAVVDRAVFAVAWADGDGRLAYANEAFARLARVDRAALLGRPVADALPWLPPDRWRALVRELDRAHSAVGDVTVGEGHAARHARLVLDRVRVGDRPLLVLFAWDTTAQRDAETQLRQAQKMEAIGQLAGGIAHDFNNLLTGILGHATVLTETTPPGSEAHEAAATITAAGLRAAELTRGLLGFARRGALETAPLDGHAVVREVARLLSRTLDKRITIQERLTARASRVRADAGQLQQALLNLAVNARDAMPEGGELTFESTVVELDARWCTRHPGTRPGPHLALTVADTGDGVPAELAGRIFEPFFTTKPAGRGTGMGLAVVYGVARDHRGAVELASAPGEGARFTLLLPLDEGAEDAAPAPCGARAPRCEGRVLVVDDEDVPREAAVRMLRQLGFEATAFARAEEAVRWVQQGGAQLRAVLLDLSMPGMDGAACFDVLRRVVTEVPVVITSGSARDRRLGTLLATGAAGFLQKPFGLAELRDALAAERKPHAAAAH